MGKFFLFLITVTVFIVSLQLLPMKILRQFYDRKGNWLSSSVSESTLRSTYGSTGKSSVASSALSMNKTKKYLLYYSQNGFANQQLCARGAYKMAQMLDRVLLLPPILPHTGPGIVVAQWILNSKNGLSFEPAEGLQHLPMIMDPFYHYLERLPADLYLPMHHVIDVDYSFAGIETMDVLSFHKLFNRSEMVQASIEADHGYSHLNTIWITNQSDLLGRTETKQFGEYGILKLLNQTYRDVVNTLAPFEEDILVFLDTFYVEYHKTIQEVLHPWQPRLANNIRRALRSHMEAEAARIPPYYASIHLRASDGPFPGLLNQTIQHVLGEATILISQWLSGAQATNTSSSTEVRGAMDKSRGHKRLESVGLFIATDLENFRDHPTFRSESLKLLQSIYDRHGVNVTILSQQDIGNATQILNGMLYADIFMDIQMSVCATIGYVPTSTQSSFSLLIEEHRQSEQECLF